MSDHAASTLEVDQDQIFTHGPKESLALVDVETYPAFVGREIDRLDLMAHLSNQMQALTVLSWKAPDEACRFRLLLTENDALVGRMSHLNPAQIASGNLRTYGQVCLVTHNHLFDFAKHRDRGLLHVSPRSKLSRPRLLNVPPGVYAISIYYHTPFNNRTGALSKPKTEVDYTVILRHYPFPPPRVAPIRLSAGIIPWVGAEASEQPWGGITSHKSPA